MGTVRKIILIGDQPSEEALAEVEKLDTQSIVYDLESPKLSPMELREFQPIISQYYKPKKEQITLKIDADILDAFKKTGKGYQTRINKALRKAVFG